MPLKIEILDPNSGTIPMPSINPGDQPGSFSHNTPEGREVYVFGCHRDGSHSTIWQSPLGFDGAEGGVREIFHLGGDALAGWPVVKELGYGESHDLDVKPDGRPYPLRIRFTHVRAGAP